jgi:hypothetical protein
VACRELGCGGALAAPGGAFFGEGAGPIILDDLRCRGNETALRFCPARPWGQHDCHHREDAGAVCDGEGAQVGSGRAGRVVGMVVPGVDGQEGGTGLSLLTLYSLPELPLSLCSYMKPQSISIGLKWGVRSCLETFFGQNWGWQCYDTCGQRPGMLLIIL